MDTNASQAAESENGAYMVLITSGSSMRNFDFGDFVLVTLIGKNAPQCGR